MLREQGKQVRVGDRVVFKSSGSTGEVRVVIPDWGVEVWVPDHNNARERWWWDSLTIRIPRKIKRYPRPFRFARLQPTQCCHCPEGVMLPIIRKNKKTIHKRAVNRRMEVLDEHRVRCYWCDFLIGSESFPHRIERAKKLLRRAEENGTLPRPTNKGSSGKKKRRTGMSKVRSKKRPTRAGVQGGKKKKAPKKSPRNLVVRSRGRKEVAHGPAKEVVSEVVIPTQESSTIPQVKNPAVPQTGEIGINVVSRQQEADSETLSAPVEKKKE